MELRLQPIRRTRVDQLREMVAAWIEEVVNDQIKCEYNSSC